MGRTTIVIAGAVVVALLLVCIAVAFLRPVSGT